MVLAGIVLFNPSINRLADNISAVVKQVDSVLLIDNGSVDVESVSALIRNNSKVKIIYNKENKGIAFALNEIFQYAKDNNYERVLTLDQDSVVADNMIEEYEKYYDDKQLLMLSCRIQDRNFTLKSNSNYGIIEKKSVITSGSYTSVYVWDTVCHFDNSMFIDFVDNDFCYRLIKSGGKILQIGSTYISHELGHSKVVHPLGFEQVIYNHSPFRCYYMIRNRLYFGRKNLSGWNFVKNSLAVLLRFCLIIMYESDKKKKLYKMLKGIKDGISMKVV